MNKYIESWIDILSELEDAFGCEEGNDDLDLQSIAELVERATPKKVAQEMNSPYNFNECPNCRDNVYSNSFCPNCGQALDWS